MAQMNVFEMLPLQGSMTAAELAAVVGKEESVISKWGLPIIDSGS
jgi:hypothetical protein